MKIILLPGLDGTGKLFNQFSSLLPSFLTVDIYTLPINGEQEPRALAESLALEKLLNEDIFIIAESFSGPIAYELIKYHKGKIKGIILVSSFLSVPHPLLKLTRWLPLSLFPWHCAPAWAIRLFCVGIDASDDLVQQVLNAINSVPAYIIAARIKALCKLRQPQDKIDIPCLYLQPSADRLIPKWHAEMIRALFHNFTMRVIPGPHFLLQANPKECVESVMEFVGSITKRGTGAPLF